MNNDSDYLTAKRIKVENNSSTSEEESLLNGSKFSIKEIKKEDCKLNFIKEIKVEKKFESADISNISKDKRQAIIPELNHILVGEIKIEDGICNSTNAASEAENSDNDLQTADDEEGSISAKIKKEGDLDDVVISSEEENSSSGSQWSDKDDKPTTSRKSKRKKRNIPAKRGNGLQIREETDKEMDSDDLDDIPSDYEEEFLSNLSKDEEFLSDGDENSSDNQDLNVDNKPVVSHLIDEYHKRPQLWFKELYTELSDLKEQELFRSINNDLSKKFKKKFNVNCTKMFFKSLCTKYEAEIERQLKENEETTAESSKLWFYDKLFFLKDDIENDVKRKLQPTLRVLKRNNLTNLINIYKKYDILWDTNNSSFPDMKKRHEALQTMCLEVKNKMKIYLNTFKLEYQLLNLHENVREEKKRRFKCEKMKTQNYKPLFSLITKCKFLENHQSPFKCRECKKSCDTYNTYREHKAKHDGSPPFQCNFCGIIFKRAALLEYHSIRHNGLNYNCSICEKKFPHPARLKDHMLVHVRESTCKICGKQCTNEKSFNQHVASHKGKQLNCDICGKGFNAKRSLKVHKRNTHDHQEVKCKICGQMCKNRESLRYHSYTHNGKKYDCHICGNSFPHPKNLKRHITSHEQKYKCSACGNKYALKYSLQKHMKVCKDRDSSEN